MMCVLNHYWYMDCKMAMKCKTLLDAKEYQLVNFGQPIQPRGQWVHDLDKFFATYTFDNLLAFTNIFTSLSTELGKIKISFKATVRSNELEHFSLVV